MWKIRAPVILTAVMRNNSFLFGVPKYSCGKTYPRRASHGKRKKFTDYGERQVTSDRAAGCRLLLMFVDGGKENRGKGLSKKKATSVYSRVCVYARVYLSGGIQRKQNKKKM